jgi:predicted metalloprotease with PDZ domain
LGQMGVDLSLRPAESQDDKGGKPARTPEEQLRRRATLGIRLAEEGAEARVANVFDGSPAQQAGMASGDIVIALDGLRVTRGTLEKRIATYPVGSQLTLHVFRRDELTELTVTLQAAPRDTCFLTLRQDVDDAMREARQSWLGPQ